MNPQGTLLGGMALLGLAWWASRNTSRRNAAGALQRSLFGDEQVGQLEMQLPLTAAQKRAEHLRSLKTERDRLKREGYRTSDLDAMIAKKERDNPEFRTRGQGKDAQVYPLRGTDDYDPAKTTDTRRRKATPPPSKAPGTDSTLPPTRQQRQLLKTLKKREGIRMPEPRSRQEASAQIDELRTRVSGVTDKQLAYIETLKARKLEQLAPRLSSGPSDRGRRAAETAILLKLPTPTSRKEASEQIDALQSRGLGLVGYAQKDKPRYQPVMQRLAEAFGTDGSGVPRKDSSGAELTGKTWQKIIADALS